MKELTMKEIEQVNGGHPVLRGLTWAGSAIGGGMLYDGIKSGFRTAVNYYYTAGARIIGSYY